MKTELGITKGSWHYKQNMIDNEMQSHFLVESTQKVLPIAKVQSDTMNLTEAEANAKLICAAPLLLETLQYALDVIKAVNNMGATKPIIGRIESAIKEATE